MNLGPKNHSPVTVTDGTTIDFTLTNQDITAETIDGAIDHDALLNVHQDVNTTAAPSFDGILATVSGLHSPRWRPASDATDALQIQKSTGAPIVNIDTTNGNVGIGTTGPGRKLEIQASAAAEYVFSVSDSEGHEQLRVRTDDDAGGGLYLWDAAGSSTNVQLEASPGVNSYINAGNVGIGTTAPSGKLHVAVDAGTMPGDFGVGGHLIVSNNSATSDQVGLTLLAGTAQTAEIAFGDSGDYNAGLIHYNNNGDYMAFRTAGSGEDMRIDSGGNVGIGTISPDRLLHSEVSDTTTNAVSYASRFTHILSTGTAAADFGVGIEFELEDSGGGNDIAALIEAVWDSPTASSEKGRLVLKAKDSGAEREGMRIEGSGTATEIGFFGVAAVVQQAYTAVSDPPTQAEVTAIRDALVNLGLMASS